jgi:predicted dehydrogenase
MEMSKTQSTPGAPAMPRREFVKSMAAAGAGLAVAQTGVSHAVEAVGKADDLNVALIGLGAQGNVLMNACVGKIPGIRFKAVCDIWSYNKQRGGNTLKKFGHDVNVYEDYQEMLAQEAEHLDAAIVATPDWMHAEHAIACMEAGLHVYSEKEMSNSLEKARQMVEASHRTGKLLQVGHQRRSNPRYHHAVNTLLHEAKILDQITQANAQWNRRKSEDLGWPKNDEMDQAKLEKYGYKSMHEFRNWRWYKKYGGGPIVDLGSHQIDIFSWVFKSNPRAVLAAGGVDYYKHHEWYDNVMAIFEYDTPEGVARAFYQVLTTTAHGLYSETFMGINGSLVISEVPQSGNHALRDEAIDPDWDVWARKGYLVKTKPPPPEKTKDTTIDIRASKPLGSWPLPVELAKPAHQPHLENFFDAVRHGTALNCPGEMGYETAVAVLRVNDAVEAGRRLEFRPEEFTV